MDGSRSAVHVDLDVQLCRAGADVVGDGERALPVRRCDRSAEVFEDRLRIAPGHRHGRNPRHRTRLVHWNSLRPVKRRPARRQRVAGDDEVVGDGAALDVTRRAPRTLREDVALAVAVIHRVGVDDQRRDAAPLGLPGLETTIAVGVRVADDGDLAAGVDALCDQSVVVLGVAAVGVDDVRGDVAGARHAEIGEVRADSVRVLVHRVAVLGERRGPLDRLDHRHRDLFRPRHEHIVAVHLNTLEARAGKLVAHVRGELEVPGGGRRVGLRGQEAEVAGGAVRVEQVNQLCFEAALGGARRRGEPGNAGGVGWRRLVRRHRNGDQENEAEGRSESLHDPSFPDAEPFGT